MGYIIFSSLFRNISNISFWKWTVCCDFVAPIPNVSFISSTIKFADLNTGKNSSLFAHTYTHFFSPILLRSICHTALCKFRACSLMV